MSNTEDTTKGKGKQPRYAPTEPIGGMPLSDALILIDYNGVIAAPKGQRAVRHTRTPLRAYLPINGTHTLTLQPGLNRIKASVWSPYEKDHTQIKRMVARRQIEVLDGLPLEDFHRMESLIERTYDHASLVWIREQLEAAQPAQQDFGYGTDYEHERRAGLLSLIAKRLGSTRPIAIESKPYHEPPKRGPGQQPAEPVLGM